MFRVLQPGRLSLRERCLFVFWSFLYVVESSFRCPLFVRLSEWLKNTFKIRGRASTKGCGCSCFRSPPVSGSQVFSSLCTSEAVVGMQRMPLVGWGNLTQIRPYALPTDVSSSGIAPTVLQALLFDSRGGSGLDVYVRRVKIRCCVA